jgi:trigger factor
MKIKVEDTTPCRKVLHIDAPADAVLPEYDKVLNLYASKAKVPGFRKGKAPVEVIERKFQKEILDDTKDHLVPQLYRDAIADKGIEPVSIIGVEDVSIEKDKGITFKVTLDVSPKFKVPKYKKIPLKKNPVSVDDKEIDETMTRIMDNFARFEDVEGRPVKSGDLVMVDYTGLYEGKSVSEIAPDATTLADNKDFWVMTTGPELLPGLAGHLEGMSEGDEKDVAISFPDDYSTTEVSGKTLDYHVQVKSIREKAPPVMDAEFWKRFEVDSEEALREKIREDLMKQAEETEKNRLKDEVVKHLLSKTSFELPESIVNQDLSRVAKSMVEGLAMQGNTQDQIEKKRDDILKDAKQTSTDRVKVSYILTAIAEAEKVVVEASEVDDRLKAMGARYGMTLPQVRAEMQKQNRIEGLENEIQADKTLTLILEHAKIKG